MPLAPPDASSRALFPRTRYFIYKLVVQSETINTHTYMKWRTKAEEVSLVAAHLNLSTRCLLGLRQSLILQLQEIPQSRHALQHRNAVAPIATSSSTDQFGIKVSGSRDLAQLHRYSTCAQREQHSCHHNYHAPIKALIYHSSGSFRPTGAQEYC